VFDAAAGAEMIEAVVVLTRWALVAVAAADPRAPSITP
jgi:hypothetical protein